MEDKNTAIVSRLVKMIASKRNFDPSKSYVSKLLNAKSDLILKKIGEEATEVILAAKGGSKKELISEFADLVFHLLVTLEFFEVGIDEVLEELEKREGVSGIDEKNSRSQL
jgi:phosphoribosyl-ATP pyrophosphohydrolase